MSRIALTQEQTHVAVGRTRTVNTNIQEQDEHECPEGEHWNEEKQACVANAVAEQEEPEACPAGQHRDPDTGECVPDESTAECNCPAGTHWNGETCVPNTSETVTIREGKKIGKLTFKPVKQPIFENLRKAGKSHEEAASEIARIEEINTSLQFIAETVNEIIDVLSKPLSVKVPTDDLGWKKTKPYNDKPLKEAIANIKPYDDALIKEAINNIKPYDDAPLKAEVATLKEAVAKKDEDLATLRRAVQIADENVTVKDKIAETKQKTLKEIAEKTEKLETETKTLKEQLEKATVRADNAEDKLSKHSEFKGTAKTLEEKAATQDLGYTPEQNIKEKKKK